MIYILTKSKVNHLWHFSIDLFQAIFGKLRHNYNDECEKLEWVDGTADILSHPGP